VFRKGILASRGKEPTQLERETSSDWLYHRQGQLVVAVEVKWRPPSPFGDDIEALQQRL